MVNGIGLWNTNYPRIQTIPVPALNDELRDETRWLTNVLDSLLTELGKIKGKKVITTMG